MRVIVTGASGYVGRHLLKCLYQHGFDVVPIGMRSAADPALRGDLTNATDIERLVEQLGHADVLVHLAAHRTGNDVERINVLLAENAFGLAARLRAHRVIHMSSAGVYARDASALGAIIDDDSVLGPKAPYERSKLRAEEAIDAASQIFGIEAVHLRPVSVFGDEPAHCLPNLRQLIRRRRMVLPDHSGFMNFVYIRDVAEATARFISSPRLDHRSYLLSDPARISEVVIVLGAILGSQRPFRTVPDVFFDMAGRLGDLAASLGLSSPITSEVVAAIREPYSYVSSRLPSPLPAWPFAGWRQGLQQCPS